YQRTPSFSPYSSLTPSSTGSNGNLSTYPHQQNISVSSGSSSSSVPTQRFGLSSRILERAHQIPERFWIDWQQKQMQDRIDELEYIKNNLGCSPGSSLHTDENGIDYLPEDSHRINDDIRRRSVLYSHEAQRLANERRTSLARTTTFDEIIPKQNIEETSPVFDNDDQSSFNFDQRSDKIDDIADLSDLDENPPKTINPISSVQQFQTTLDRSRLTMSLPFTYTNAREQIIFPTTNTNYRQISVQPLLEKVIEVSSDDAMETITSPTNSIEDVAQINTEVNLTLLKREDPQKINPLYYTRATVNRNIEFRKFRPLLSRNNMNSINKDTTISIPIFKRKEINDSRSSSPTLSFKSTRSRFSSITDCEDLNDDIQSLSVISSSSLSLSVPSRSYSTSPYNNISPVTQYTKRNNNYPSSKQVSSHNYTCFPQDLSMINNVSSDFEQENENYSCSSCSITSSEVVEEIKDNLSFSYPLFTSSQRQRKRKKKSSNSSYLTLVSTSSSSSSSLQNNRSRLSNSFCQTKENNNKRTLKIAHNTSIISSKRTWQWKQNDGGFRRDILVNNNNDSNDDVTRSSSPSIATAVADRRLIQRQRRKQTRLKGKAESKKRKEKKKNRKKERNKKSLLSTTEVEAAATEAPLFQFSTVDRAIPDKRVIFYPYEQLRCVDRSKAKEKVCFPIQTTSAEHQKQESKLNSTMADGYTNNTIPKRKENVRVFVRRRRRTTRQRKRTFLHSSSSSNSHETIPSSPNNLEELVTLIQQEINNKQEKSQKNKNIIVVNYKPVFINSNQQKQPPSSSPTKVSSSIPISKPKLIPTDDDFSSATHYSRRHSLTTTSSDGSPLRSTTNRSQQQSQQQQSASLDVPDVEDPLMFIEMMYQQLFTEDGRLRNGTESTALADCVKQIVRNSRRNSISSSIANGTASPHSKHHHHHLNINHQQQKYSSPLYHHRTPSKSQSLSSSPHLIPNGEYNSTTEEEEEEEPEEEKDDDDDEEEEEEEPNTLVQVNNQRPVIIMNTDTTKNSEQLKIDNYSQIHAFLNSCQQKQITINRPTTATTTSNGFRFSIDDTDNEDFDTFSDLNSIRFNTKTIGTSPSIDEDLTHTDSRFLSSSGYHSLDRSTRFLKQQKLILSKSHSENDLFHSMYKTNIQTRCIHYCPDCIHPPIITVIPPLTSTSLSIIRRIQQPIGDMIMKYLNFILVSKNVLLLPLFIFLLRQRSIHVGN
ncbi:unnamed protein product, partial [Adineta steineri]